MVDINGAGDGGNGRSIICGPAGDVLHQFGTSEELVPLEIDLDRVRRYREVGLRGLGQPLKSFRDSEVQFPVYEPGGKTSEYLQSLGPLDEADSWFARGLGRRRPRQLERLPLDATNWLIAGSPIAKDRDRTARHKDEGMTDDVSHDYYNLQNLDPAHVRLYNVGRLRTDIWHFLRDSARRLRRIQDDPTARRRARCG